MRFSFSLRICLVLLIVTSCGTTQNAVTQNSNSSGIILVPTTQKDLQAAVVAGEIGECDKASTEILKNNCRRDFITLQAKEQSDKHLCDSLGNDDRKTCIYNAVLSKAKQEENLEICKEFSTQDLITACEDALNHSLGEKKQDSVFCDKIQNSEVKSYCKSLIKNDADCAKFSNQIDRDHCILTQEQHLSVMALVKNQKKIDCATILDMDLRQLCGQEMGLITAVEKKDKVLCESLSTSFSFGEVQGKNYRGECLRQIK